MTEDVSFLFAGDFESRDIGCLLGFFVFHPKLVRAGREQQAVDVVRELAAIIGSHGKYRKLCSVRSAEVGIDIGVRREATTLHLRVIAAVDAFLGQGDLGIRSLRTRGYDE